MAIKITKILQNFYVGQFDTLLQITYQIKDLLSLNEF